MLSISTTWLWFVSPECQFVNVIPSCSIYNRWINPNHFYTWFVRLITVKAFSWIIMLLCHWACTLVEGILSIWIAIAENAHSMWKNMEKFVSPCRRASTEWWELKTTASNHNLQSIDSRNFDAKLRKNKFKRVADFFNSKHLLCIQNWHEFGCDATSLVCNFSFKFRTILPILIE